LLVELDAFSGRPNPRWELDDAGSERLRALIARLSAASGAPAEPAGLGYRGFICIDASERLRAFKGHVIKPGVVLADPSLRVEKFLLDRLPPELQELGMRVAAELQTEGPPS
jgi:hypothetical protein